MWKHVAPNSQRSCHHRSAAGRGSASHKKSLDGAEMMPSCAQVVAVQIVHPEATGDVVSERCGDRYVGIAGEPDSGGGGVSTVVVDQLGRERERRAQAFPLGRPEPAPGSGCGRSTRASTTSSSRPGLVVYSCAFMAACGIVLFVSDRRLWRGRHRPEWTATGRADRGAGVAALRPHRGSAAPREHKHDDADTKQQPAHRDEEAQRGTGDGQGAVSVAAAVLVGRVDDDRRRIVGAVRVAGQDHPECPGGVRNDLVDAEPELVDHTRPLGRKSPRHAYSSAPGVPPSSCGCQSSSVVNGEHEPDTSTAVVPSGTETYAIGTSRRWPSCRSAGPSLRASRETRTVVPTAPRGIRDH